MGRGTRLVAVLTAVLSIGFFGRAAQAQQTIQNLTPAQEVVSRYVLPAGAIPASLQPAGISALDNVLVAALAEDPAQIQKIIDRGRLDGIEQDFSQSNGGNAQIQLQFSLYRDSTGAAADVPDPSLLAGQGATTIPGPSFGDLSAAYTTQTPSLETTNIVFTSGRLEVLMSEVGPTGSTNQMDIVPLARLIESRVRQTPVPQPTSDELAVLQTQTMPEHILQDAYNLLLQNYLTKLPPSQILGAAWTGATKALTDAGASGLPGAPTITATDGDQAWSQFLPAYQVLEKLAPSSVSAKDLTYAAATEMYNNLNCHTTFFTPTMYTRENQELKGSQEARIGILLQKFPDVGYAILRVESGSPAEQAGLKAGDVIQAIDHQTQEQAGTHFSDLFVGAAGSAVTLTIQRPGVDLPFDVTAVRQLINPVIAQHRILPGGIGYIELDEFTDGDASVTGVANALKDFDAAANVNSWILDLRYNSGGSEETLRRVAGLFVPQGSLLVTETEQDGTVSRARSIGTPVPNQKSMVLLVGKDTASAAEIFSQSMEDLGRVTLVGEPTAGCVNGGLPLGLLDGSGVFVSTIDVRSGPNRVPLENVGAKPDVTVTQSLTDVQNGVDPVLAAAIDLFTGTPIPPSPAPATAALLPRFAAFSLIPGRH